MNIVGYRVYKLLDFRVLLESFEKALNFRIQNISQFTLVVFNVKKMQKKTTTSILEALQTGGSSGGYILYSIPSKDIPL